MSSNFDLVSSQIYVFGDSLSDTGNVFNFTNGEFPSFPYAPGRFSDGRVWLDYLAEDLNITVDPFTSGWMRDNSLNFAIGGATSGENNVGVVPLGLEQQIDAFELLSFFQSQSSEVVLDDDLFFLWIGSNDYFSFIKDDPTTPDTVEASFPESIEEIRVTAREVVKTNIGDAVRDLIDLGAENIVVFNLPDLHKTPLGRNLEKEDRKTLRQLTNVHNRKLLAFVEETETLNPNVDIIHVDTNDLFDRVLENPAKFGFTDVESNYTGIDLYAATSQAPSIGNPSEYLFWDSVHLTTSAQSLVADLVMEQLTSEGFTI